jgi:Uncharacterised ACR (DUF711)
MKRLIATILLCAFAASAVYAASDVAKPKVRAITAFVRLDRRSYENQVTEAMTVLKAAKAEFAKRGYETETVRIVTQPFAELVKDLSDQDALAFLRSLDDLSQKEGFRAERRSSAVPGVGRLLFTPSVPCRSRARFRRSAATDWRASSALVAGGNSNTSEGSRWSLARLCRYRSSGVRVR